MPDARSRARVERLLRGEFRPDDIASLFLFARDHCDGRETVSDIGDFVAHHSERDRGIVTRLTREWFATARYYAASLRPNAPPHFDGQKLPPVTQEYFKIAVNRIPAQIIREKTGFRREVAYKIMLSVASRLNQNANGTWHYPRICQKMKQPLSNVFRQ